MVTSAYTLTTVRIGFALVLVACSSPKDKPAIVPPPPPQPSDAALADADVVRDAPASPSPVVTSTSMADACDQASIHASASSRALLFSCLGIAIDIPHGMSADGGPRELDGIVVEIASVGAGDDGEVAIVGEIEAARSELEPSVELSSPEADTIIQLGGEELRGKAVAPAKRARNRVHRVFREGERSGLLGSVVTPDGLHTLRFSFMSELSPAELEKRVTPLMKVRPMTAKEITLAPLPEDLTPLLVDRVVPVEKDGSKHELVLCKNGTYHVTSAVGEIAKHGRWRMSFNTLWISHKHFLAEGVFDDGLGSIHVGMFGKTTLAPPFPPAGDRCATAR